MLVLIADRLPDWVPEQLAKLGFEVSMRPETTADDLDTGIDGAHVLIVRSTRVNAPCLQKSAELMLVIRAGAGVNTIDVAEAAARGIHVANTPGQNAAAVAELTMGLLLAVDRRIPAGTSLLKEGAWDKKRFSNATGLKGRRMGIIGWGRIGQAVAERARAFALEVHVFSRSLTPEIAQKAGVGFCADVQTLCIHSDIVSLHVAMTEETRGILDAKAIAQLPDGAIVLNTSRGGLIDQDALLSALEERGFRAGLDVYDDEPPAGDSAISDPVARHQSVVGTHHIGASTQQAQDAVAAEVVRVLTAFIGTGEVPNCVNLAEETLANWLLTVRHFDRVGVLAGVLDVLKEARINVQEMENTIFAGGLAAICTIRMDSRPNEETLALLASRENILGLQLTAL